jgi:NAD(P)H-dependent flavin oxidoreductase YrpB (nitropropane dioxygenase family)
MAPRHTAFTELVGCIHPVQLAAMAGCGGPALAAAVQGAGGLGMVSWFVDLPDEACGINFLVPFLPRRDEITSIAGRARVAEFFYGEPNTEAVEAAHRGGAIVGWQVGSTAEALAAERAGCDYLIAQGVEAGGHVRGTAPLDALLPAVVEVTRVPVLAAGAIATAARVAEVIGLGAAGVRVGTRFLASVESNAHEDYVENLIASSGDDTELTEWFDRGWPNAPHRVLRSALDAARQQDWHDTQPPTRGENGSVSAMAQYAGMGVGDVTSVEPVAAIVADLVRLL